MADKKMSIRASAAALPGRRENDRLYNTTSTSSEGDILDMLFM